jgi:hypothetical protein
MASCLALCILAVTAGPLYASVARDYGSGVTAIRKEDWRTVSSKMQAAIAEDPQEKAEILISGKNRLPYLPHFLLGKALMNLDDCTGAIRAWQTSIDQGVIQNHASEYQELQQGMELCKSLAIDYDALAADARVELEALDGENQAFARLSDTRLQSEWDERWSPQLQTSRDAAQSLRAQLDAGISGMDEGQIQSVGEEARTLAQNMSRLTEQAGIREQELIEADQIRAEQARQEELNSRLAAHANLRTTIENSVPKLREAPQGTRSRDLQNRLSGLVEAGNQLTIEDSAAQLRRSQRDIASTALDFDRAVQAERIESELAAKKTPTQELENVANAYFAGDYQSVINLASASADSDMNVRIQMYLFRSAAKFNLYSLSGGADQALLSDARNDIRSIKQMSQSFSPFIPAFSPKFLTFFKETG